MSDHASTPCKSCKAPIFFARTEKGHLMPVNVSRSADGSGNVELRQTAGGWLEAVVHAKGIEGGYTSHFTTCPARLAHRGKKGRKS